MIDTDAIIAEAFPQPEVQPEIQEEVKVEEPQQTEETTENEVDNNDDNVVFPKKAVNAISRRDRQIGKQKAELAQLRAEIAQIKAMQPQATTAQSQPQTPQNGEPNIADYDNVLDYSRALAKWEAKQEITKELTERERKQAETAQATRNEQYIAEKNQVIATQAVKFFNETPDAKATLDEYSDVIDELPQGIVNLLYEADNAPLALYNLAKSGKIEELGNMTLAKAAFEIGRAEAQLPQKQQTKAPTPMQSGKGIATKNINSMDFYALKKELGLN